MSDWSLQYDSWEPSQQPLREALCTLGNGYIATRGAHETVRAGGLHYPGTYLAGGYDRLKSEINETVIENEDLVNWPNWIFLTFRANDGPWFSIDEAVVLAYSQELDLAEGVLRCDMTVRDDADHETRIVSERLVHMGSFHLAAIRWKLQPLNWSGAASVRSALDGTIINSGVPRYRDLNSKHLRPIQTGRAEEDGIFLEVQTVQSHITMAQAARTHVYQNGSGKPVTRRTAEDWSFIRQELDFSVDQHETIDIEKIVSIYTSRDMAINEPVTEACAAIRYAESFDHLYTTHRRAWQHLWHRGDLIVTGDNQTQMLARLHAFHVIQTTSMNTINQDVGIPSRGWHGEAYRGHIMWDELFVFPYLTLRIPVLSRELLMYRYRRLQRARWMARESGYKGAMFPWQSGSDGREESQRIHLNPQSGRWVADTTWLQRHVNAAIVYNAWQYYQATYDKEFLYYYGAELVLDIARFWDSITKYNPDRDRFEIHGVVGPDEYHTSYPDSDEAGINNNTYTNIMVCWVLLRALDVIEILDNDRREELFEMLDIDGEEIRRWEEISRRMYVPFLDNGILAQFEGYDRLQELDWTHYRKEYGENMRLDRILESEGDSANRYKAAKQADVLMLFYLFSSEEIKDLLAHMGYEFNTSIIPSTIDYYYSRSSHGSTLSRLVFSWVLSRADRSNSWHVFEKALLSDFADVQGGTTPEGIHLGAMAGTIDMIQRCYPGIEVRNDVLWLNPALPRNIECIKQRIRYRSHWISLIVKRECLSISVEEGWGNPVQIGFQGTVYTFKRKENRTFPIA